MKTFIGDPAVLSVAAKLGVTKEDIKQYGADTHDLTEGTTGDAVMAVAKQMGVTKEDIEQYGK